MTGIQIIPLMPKIGAEVTGLDLRDTLSEVQSKIVCSALAKYGVICLRGHKLEPEMQVSFTRIFGEPAINHNAKKFGINGSPEIYRISNIVENGKPIGTPKAGTEWHSDMCYAMKPAKATMLHARKIPQLNGFALGDTSFANAAAAWDALPVALKRKISNLRVVYDFTRRKRGAKPSKDAVQQYPPVSHPLVRSHPVTGRKSLYVSGESAGIEGKSEEEGRILIEALASHIVHPAFVYRHSWSEGDVVVWDNCTCQHKAEVDYDLPLERLMWRTTVKGSIPK